MSKDRDLHQRFGALRAEDAARAEPASQMLGSVRARANEREERENSWSARPWRTWAPAAAALALIAGVWWTLPQSAPAPRLDTELPLSADLDLRRLGSLRTPTDALLGFAPPTVLGSRPPELLPLPKLPAPAPVRESAATRRTLS